MPGIVHILGCGPGGEEHLTREAGETVARVQTLVGPLHLLELFPQAAARRQVSSARVAEVVPLLEEAREAGDVALLVTGDPGLHSLARRVLERLGTDACRVVPGISSLQLACARAGLSWESLRVVSLHGAAEAQVAPRLHQALREAPAALLTDPTHTPQRIARRLAETGAAETPLWVGAELGRPGECIVEGTAVELAGRELSGRSVVLLRGGPPAAAGVVWGVGVGPGDPDLLTVRAARLIRRADVVFVPREARTETSPALVAAAPWLDAARVEELVYEARPGRRPDRSAWADRLAAVAAEGRRAVFLTLGDPLTYSTWIYVLPPLLDRLGAQRVRTVPGVTSFAAAAAAGTLPLAAGAGEVQVLPVGRNGLARVRAGLHSGATLVLLKVRAALAELRQLLAEEGRAENALYAQQVGQSGELICRGLAELPEQAEGALALILVPPAGD